jgi:tetratricopeptide (TPR) repeat protein
MAADLRRFLAGEPVHARPPGPLKRALRWGRRRPAPVGVALLAVLLVASIVLLGGAARRAAESSVEARKEAMLSRAWRAIDAGDLERAREETDAFEQSFPDDPSGSLVMVAGYAQNLRVQAMEDELAAVAQHELPEGSSAAFRRLIAGLRLVAGGRLSDYPVVLDHLEAAMELDPDLETVVLYPIYQMRWALGDVEGAAEALEAYRGVLRTSSPVVQVVDALLLEVQGQPAAGADRLRELIAEVGEASFVGISGFRELGRMELRAFTQDAERGERLDAALEALQLAVDEHPADKGAWANLALARPHKHDRTPSTDQRKEWLALTDEAARRCLELAPAESTALEVLVMVEWNRLESFVPSPGAVETHSVETQLVQVVERLEAVKPESPLVAHGRSMLAYFRGLRERSAGRMDPARRFFLEAAGGNELNISAHLELGQIEHMHRQDFGAALKAFLAAESAWEGLDEVGMQPGRPQLFSARVWAFGAADHAGELDLAYEYRERALEMLAEPGVAQLLDLCNLAEFLAAPANLELRDCDTTRRLLAQHPIAETLVALNAATTLELLRSACGD